MSSLHIWLSETRSTLLSHLDVVLIYVFLMTPIVICFFVQILDVFVDVSYPPRDSCNLSVTC